MDDLISRKALLNDYFNKWDGHVTSLPTLINSQPSAQRKGHWIDGTVEHVSSKEKRKVRRCSECGSGYFIYDLSIGVYRGEPNYCPNCGADMRGEDDG